MLLLGPSAANREKRTTKWNSGDKKIMRTRELSLSSWSTHSHGTYPAYRRTHTFVLKKNSKIMSFLKVQWVPKISSQANTLLFIMRDTSTHTITTFRIIILDCRRLLSSHFNNWGLYCKTELITVVLFKTLLTKKG